VDSACRNPKMDSVHVDNALRKPKMDTVQVDNALRRPNLNISHGTPGTRPAANSREKFLQSRARNGFGVEQWFPFPSQKQKVPKNVPLRHAVRTERFLAAAFQRFKGNYSVNPVWHQCSQSSCFGSIGFGGTRRMELKTRGSKVAGSAPAARKGVGTSATARCQAWTRA